MEKNKPKKKGSKQPVVIELPPEILMLILSSIDTNEDITAWSLVSKRFNHYISNDASLHMLVEKYRFLHKMAHVPIKDRIINIAMSGPGGAGKSSTAIRITTPNVNIEVYDPTIEDTDRFKVTVDGEEYTVCIMDWGCVDMATVESWYKTQIHGVYFVYSVVNSNDFEQLKEHIARVHQWKQASNFPMIIAENKIDLVQWRTIQPEQGQRFADLYNALFFETSAKNGTNVNDAFMALVKRIVEVEKYNTRVHQKAKSKRDCAIM